jgi:hypothetical protein
VLLGHSVLCGVMTMFAFMLPWIVAHAATLPNVHGPATGLLASLPPTRALIAALLASIGAALLIVVVVHGFGVARLRLATTGVLVVLVFFLYGIGPFFGIPAVKASKRAIHLLDRTYSARPLADKLNTLAPPNETIAVFHVRRDVEYGLAFYRNHQVVNYEETGVPDEEHLLVARMIGRGGSDLHTQDALEQYLEGREYQPLLTWPEQGLEIYLVGPHVGGPANLPPEFGK